MSPGECPGCGGLHPKRTTAKDHCPCCAHPHADHGDYGCAVCLCMWAARMTAWPVAEAR